MAAECSPEPYKFPAIFVQIDGVVYLPHVDKKLLDQISQLPVEDGDVFLVTYPKAGTTWISEIVRQIYTGGEIDKTDLRDRVLFLDYFNTKVKGDPLAAEKFPTVMDWYRTKSHPRLFKTHFPYHLCPQGAQDARPKYIYVVRNPKDTMVSVYHHLRRIAFYEFDRSWDEFFEMEMEERSIYGSWFDHVLGWWEHRGDPSILFLKYEDMKKDLKRTVRQVADFVGKSLSEELVEKIANQTTFQAMKYGDDLGDQFYKNNNPSWIVPGEADFLRKGIVGDWRNYFTPEQNRRFDERYAKRMERSGLSVEF